MFRIVRVAVPLVLALFAGSAAAEDSPAFTQQSPEAPMVHKLSGFAFPLHIGSFERGDALRDGPGADDVSVAYNDAQARIVATLYVYPTHDRDLTEEFELRQHEVTDAYPKAKLLSKGEAKVTPAGREARIARYVFTVKIHGQPRRVHTELLVAQAGAWFVEYRISYAARDQKQAQPRVDDLKAAFAWP